MDAQTRPSSDGQTTEPTGMILSGRVECLPRPNFCISEKFIVPCSSNRLRAHLRDICAAQHEKEPTELYTIEPSNPRWVRSMIIICPPSPEEIAELIRIHPNLLRVFVVEPENTVASPTKQQEEMLSSLLFGRSPEVIVAFSQGPAEEIRRDVIIFLVAAGPDADCLALWCSTSHAKAPERAHVVRKAIGNFHYDLLVGSPEYVAASLQSVPEKIFRQPRSRLQRAFASTHHAPRFTPVCLIGNGPSLTEAACRWLQLAQKGTIVVAAGSSQFTLLKYGVIPDLSFDIGPAPIPLLTEELYNQFLLVADQIPIFAPFDQMSSLIETQHRTLPQVRTHYICMQGLLEACLQFSWGNRSLPTTASSVQFALDFCIRHNFSQFYLLGCDFGRKAGQPFHAVGSLYDQPEGDEEIQQNRMKAREKKEIELLTEEVAGNFGGKVDSGNFLSKPLEVFQRCLAETIPIGNVASAGKGMSERTLVYNLSDGVLVDHTVASLIEVTHPPENSQQKQKDLDAFLADSEPLSKVAKTIPMDRVEEKARGIRAGFDHLIACSEAFKALNEPPSFEEIWHTLKQERDQFIAPLRAIAAPEDQAFFFVEQVIAETMLRGFRPLLLLEHCTKPGVIVTPDLRSEMLHAWIVYLRDSREIIVTAFDDVVLQLKTSLHH